MLASETASLGGLERLTTFVLVSVVSQAVDKREAACLKGTNWVLYQIACSPHKAQLTFNLI